MVDNNDNCHINILIGTLTGGGAERVVSTLLSYPLEETTLTLFSSKNMRYNINSGVVPFVFESYKNNTIFSSILYKISPRILFGIYMHYIHLKKNRYDVSVSFLNIENCINILVSNWLDIPAVVSIRNNMSSTKGPTYILSIVLGILLHIYSPYVIVNSEDNKTWLINKYHLDENKCICIYNPKDVEEIQALSQKSVNETFFDTDELILVTVGRLLPQKGHLHLLRIFKELRMSIPCRLVICGVGELDDSLKKLANDLGISEFVLFTGWCENPYKYMKHSDVFVFTSLFEGQPNALIEALICGCPVVSTDCDYGPREILANGKYGILTQKLDGNIENPTENPLTPAEREMYEKVLHLLQHPEEREKLRCLSSEQISLFEKDSCISKYYAVFRAATNRKSLINVK